MLIRSWEIVNVIFTFLFLVKIFCRNQVAILFYLFVYCTLHFAYAAWPVIVGMPAATINLVHIEGSGILATTSAAIVLLSALLALVFANIHALREERVLRNIFLGSIVLITISYAFNVRIDNFLQLKNVFGIVFIVLMPLLLMSLSDWSGLVIGTEKRKVFMVILFVMVFVAFFEVYSLRAWATFENTRGEVIFRSSSLMFNPNLFGLWCVLVALGAAYLFQRNREGDGGFMLTVLVMAMSGLYMAGSRGLALALFICLFGIAIVAKKMSAWRRWVPTLAMPTVFLCLVLLSSFIGMLNEGHRTNWNAFVLLGERFVALPIYLARYCLSHVIQFPSVPLEFAESVEGRFVGELRDSGWLVVYDDAGWLGVAVLLGLWSYFAFLGLRTYYRYRDITSIYALAALLLSLATGLFMRFQIFPTGLFVAFMLAPCLNYWRLVRSAD